VHLGMYFYSKSAHLCYRSSVVSSCIIDCHLCHRSSVVCLVSSAHLCCCSSVVCLVSSAHPCSCSSVVCLVSSAHLCCCSSVVCLVSSAHPCCCSSVVCLVSSAHLCCCSSMRSLSAIDASPLTHSLTRMLSHAGARSMWPSECGIWPGRPESGGPEERHHHVHVPAAGQPGLQTHAQGGFGFWKMGVCVCVHILYYTTPVFAAGQPGLQTHAQGGFGFWKMGVSVRVFIFCTIPPLSLLRTSLASKRMLKVGLGFGKWVYVCVCSSSVLYHPCLCCGPAWPQNACSKWVWVSERACRVHLHSSLPTLSPCPCCGQT